MRISAFIILLAMPALAADEKFSISTVMQRADLNHDGKLCLAEYLPLDVQAKHHGDEHFTAGDTNHDGFLDPLELGETLKKQTWFAILSEGTEACFARIDANKDDKLDLTEYRKISRMGAHAEQHFKSADRDDDSFLNKAEFTTHAGHVLEAIEVISSSSSTPNLKP
ncbi:MAG: EF-hand domain pair [Verrucomicrobiota bacterium]|jgi:hypothetical protein